MLLCLCLNVMAYAAEPMDMSGQWRFQLDSLGIGESEAWYNKQLADNIQLPGTTDDARKGKPNTLKPELRKPQLLRLTRRYTYVGKAWYQRDFTIGKRYRGQSPVPLIHKENLK